MDTNPRVDNYLIFDFETGGKVASKNLAIEFAGIWIDSYDFREIDRYEDLILPYSDALTIEQAALDANGIALEEIAEFGVELDVVVKTIIEKTVKCNEGKMRGKKTILVGQNVIFDIPFLQQIFKVTKQDLSKYFTGDKDYFGNFSPTYMDTLFMGRNRHAQDEQKIAFGLKELCQYEDIDLTNSHRAMPDTESTKELFIKFMTALRGDSNSSVYNHRDHFKFQI